jgi:hypothetical protein
MLLVFDTSKVTELVRLLYICVIQSLVVAMSIQQLENYVEPENCVPTTAPPTTTSRRNTNPNIPPTARAEQPLSKCGILFLLNFLSVLLIFG